MTELIELFRRWRRRILYRLGERTFRKVDTAGGLYRDKDLVYAARARCLCGAGMAYPRGASPFHYWDCSDILTGRAAPRGQAGATKHEAQLPFAYYEILSEGQPSARGATTRKRHP